MLGIKPGEAVVTRNIGGRITPGLLEQLGLLGRIGEVAGKIPGGGGEFHIIVLQHTDCGITRLVGDPAMLAHYFQIPEAELKTKTVTDPRAAVAADVASLRAIPALPSEWLISGLVYDVATGLAEVVVPAARIRRCININTLSNCSGSDSAEVLGSCFRLTARHNSGPISQTHLDAGGTRAMNYLNQRASARPPSQSPRQRPSGRGRLIAHHDAGCGGY